jgi:hypothetical protein
LLLPNFLPMFLINFQKKSKIAKKKNNENPKNAFLIYLQKNNGKVYVRDSPKFCNRLWISTLNN